MKYFFAFILLCMGLASVCHAQSSGDVWSGNSTILGQTTVIRSYTLGLGGVILTPNGDRVCVIIVSKKQDPYIDGCNIATIQQK